MMSTQEEEDSNGNSDSGEGVGGEIQLKPLAVRKATKRTCSVEGCKNGIVQGGVCIAHGAKRRKCHFPGCVKNSKSAGLCSRHGPPRKKCDAVGCINVAVQQGKCKSHGGQPVTCMAPGCTSIAVGEGPHCKLLVDDKKHAEENPEPEQYTKGLATLASLSNTFCPPTLDNSIMAQNQEILQRVLAQNAAWNALSANMLAMGSMGGFANPMAALGSANLNAALALNSIAVNPVMPSTMGMYMGGMSLVPQPVTSFGYGSQMIPSLPTVGSLGYCGLGFHNQMGYDRMLNQSLLAKMSGVEEAKTPDVEDAKVPAFRKVVGFDQLQDDAEVPALPPLDGETGESEDPQPKEW